MNGYSREGDTITITMSAGDYNALLICLGMAGGMAIREGSRQRFHASLALANRLNAGNPAWQPYEIPPEAANADPQGT